MTLPEAENQIQAVIGSQNLDLPWKEGLHLVMNAENDSQIAVQALNDLKEKSTRPRLVIRIPARKPPQVEETETQLMNIVHSLKDRNRIHGPVPSVDEIVEGPDEVDPEVEELPIDDDSIVAAVRKEMAAPTGDVIEIDDEEMDEEEKEQTPKINYAELPQFCTQLEAACMTHLDKPFCADLLTNLRKFRGLIRSEQIRSAKQTTLDAFFRVP